MVIPWCLLSEAALPSLLRMATRTLSPSPPFASLLLFSPLKRPSLSLSKPRIPSLASFHSPFVLRPIQRLSRSSQRIPPFWRISAEPGDALPPPAPVDEAQQIVSSALPDNDITSTIISTLLFVAFIGLSILTIGVIYLGVTDFLQKRERDKFEKEEAANKKKGGKKQKVKARAGPRGFGQKIEDEQDDDDN